MGNANRPQAVRYPVIAGKFVRDRTHLPVVGYFEIRPADEIGGLSAFAARVHNRPAASVAERSVVDVVENEYDPTHEMDYSPALPWTCVGLR